MKFLGTLLANSIMNIGLFLVKISYSLHKQFKTELGNEILALEKKRQEILNQFYTNLLNLTQPPKTEDEDFEVKTRQHYDA